MTLWQKAGRLLSAAGVGCVLNVGCSKPDSPQQEALATPLATPAPPAAASQPGAAALPPATPAAPPKTATAAPSVAALETRYFSGSTGADERTAIIRELGDVGTPAAAEVLLRIFGAEKRLDTRMTAFEVMFDLPDETAREQKFRLLQRGLAPEMAKQIRLSMVQMLGEFDDPRREVLLRTLAADREPEVRRLAMELLEERR